MAKKRPFAHLDGTILSDIGRKRKNNEDSIAAFPDHGVWCVADGMGGGDDGEVASSAVVRSLDACLANMPVPDCGEYPASAIASEFDKAISAASAWIYDRAREKKLKGCGSTVVGVIFDPTRPDTAITFHAGDSRLYRLRGKELKQITKDHSVAEMMGAKEEKNLNPMFRGMILRAVGIERDVQLEFTPMNVKEGDAIVICSDGLTRMVSDKRLAEIVRENKLSKVAAKALIDEANEEGGLDNISVAVVRVGALPPPAPAVSLHTGEDSEDVSAETLTTAPEEETTIDKVGKAIKSRPNFAILAASLGVLLVSIAILVVALVRGDGEPAIDGKPVPEKDIAVSAPVQTQPEAMPTPPKETPKKKRPTLLDEMQGEVFGTDKKETQELSYEDMHRKVAEDILRATRESREKADANAAAEEEERVEIAEELALLYPKSEFSSFAAFVTKALGEGETTKLETFARALNLRRKDVKVCTAAEEFAAEICRVCAEVTDKASGKVHRDILRQCSSLSKMEPSSPETQRRCLELVNAVSVKLMEGRLWKK